MKKLLVTLSVIAILGTLVLVGFLNLNETTVQNAKFAAQVDDLKLQIDELQTRYYNLLSNYSSLQWNYTNVLLQTPTFAPNPAAASAATDNSSYISRYQSLANLYYNLLNEYNEYQANYQALKALTDQRLMRRDLSGLIMNTNPEIVNLARNITGRTENTTTSINWGDIKALYDWVNNNIQYRDDGLYPVLPDNPADAKTGGLDETDQMAQMPNETLQLRKGDCEDTAVLLCSLVRAYFNNSYTCECIWITGASAGHVAVMIPFSGEKICILDPVRDYFSHDTLGDIQLNTISNEIYIWTNIWRPSLGNDMHVYRVFSDYMDKTFNTTEEFINWMYVR